MYKQGIIDYVYTNDSDIIAFGTDLITNVSSNGKCWIMSFDNLMKRLEDKINNLGNGREQLFHLKENPLELNDVYLANKYCK